MAGCPGIAARHDGLHDTSFNSARDATATAASNSDLRTAYGSPVTSHAYTNNGAAYSYLCTSNASTTNRYFSPWADSAADPWANHGTDRSTCTQ
jgi:hypothetical protein